MRYKITLLLLILSAPAWLSAQMELVTRNQLQTHVRYTRYKLAEIETARRLVEQGAAPAGAPKMYRPAGREGCGQQMH